MSNLNNTTKKYLPISEKAAAESEEYCFEIEERIVNKLLNIIHNPMIGKKTIAVTGEWGIGKTTVINSLRDKLATDKKNIIIDFEPLLEGKFELIEIMALFYVKLSKQLKDDKIKEMLLKIEKNLAIVKNLQKHLRYEKFKKIICKIRIFFNPIKKFILRIVKGVLALKYPSALNALKECSDNKEPSSFSDQTKELNDFLVKNGYKIHIFIDEIDRLPAKYILNFLHFSRVLDQFDSLVCIIGLDYEQVIFKLMKESTECQNDYYHAQSYLEKFLQIKQPVYHNPDQIIYYAIKGLEALDDEKILEEIIQSDNNDIKEELEKIILYLSTPRAIKQWFIGLSVNYPLLKNSHSHKLNFIGFIAATIKHPILIDYLSKYGLKFLTTKNPYSDLKDEIGVNFNVSEYKDNEIIAATMGIILKPKKNDIREEVITKLKIQKIDDIQTARYVTNYLQIPLYLISLFVEGFIDENQVSAYPDFFGENIDKVLKMLSADNKKMDWLASDLYAALHKGIKVKATPTIALLNELWAKKVNENLLAYEKIILFSICKIEIEKIISECPIGLSQYTLSNIFNACGFKNKKGIYEFSREENAENTFFKKGKEDVKFNNTKINEFDEKTIKEIISDWTKKFENDLRSKDISTYKQIKLIDAFYRYVQWNYFLNEKEEDRFRSKLTTFLVNYLTDESIQANDKVYLKKIINQVKEQFERGFHTNTGDPLEFLFNNDPKLIELINSN